ncbi:MAG: type II toxin-antitoxin system HicB family antitoxin [Syntrophobacteraceae bacterium]
MNNTMRFKGYTAGIEYSDEDACFVGHLAGITDLVGFHADTVTRLRSAFEEAVEDYLEACDKVGRSPQKPYSGKLLLRVSPELHAKVSIAAKTSGKSLNQWATEALDQAVNRT